MAGLTVTNSEPLPAKGLSVVKSEPLSEDQPVLPRALKNLPRSLVNFGKNAMPIGAWDNPPVDPATGRWNGQVTGPLDDIGHILGSLLNIPLHPEESFAEDPVGTVAYPLLALKGGVDVATHPTTRSIGRGMVNQVKTELPDIHQWGKAGGILGGVLGGGGLESILHEGGTGYGVGAGARSLPALIRGALQGWRDRPVPFVPSELSGRPTEGRFDPAQYGAGANPIVPPVETGGGHVPDYTGPMIQPPVPPTPRPAPAWEGIQPVQTGPTVFSPEPAATSLTGRAPGPAEIPLPGVSEISGRPSTGRFTNDQYGAPPVRPTKVGGYKSAPIKPAVVDLSTPESLIPPVQTSAPAAGSEVVTGLHLPEVPKHYAGEPNPTAAFKNDQAIVAELRKVPGITQDSLTPDMVHEVRKALGQRRLRDVDVDRRVQHIRHMLPK